MTLLSPSDSPRGSGIIHLMRALGITLLGLAAVGILLLIVDYGRESQDQHAPEETKGASPSSPGSESQESPSIRTVPFDEPGEDPDSENKPTAEVTVVTGDGEPAAGAVILVARKGKLLQRRQAGAAGVTRLNRQTDEILLIVAHRGWPLHFEERELPPGQHTVHLQSGQGVSGTLLEKGRPPDPALTLELWDEESVPLPARLQSLTSELPSSHGSSGQLEIMCDSKGRFRLGGLAPSWRGRLELPPGWKFEESLTDRHTLVRPLTGLELPVIRAPTITGRVVDGNGDPVPKASVVLRWGADNFGTLTKFLHAGKDGRFSCEVDSRMTRLSVVVETEGRAGRRQIEVEGDFSAGRDLGDISLSTYRVIEFVVRGVDGLPISGAYASADDSGSGWRAEGGPTDAAGQGKIEVDLGRQFVRVAAIGYGTETVIVPSSTVPLEVVLRRANGIRVKVAVPAGIGFGDLRLRFSADKPFLAWRADGMPSGPQLSAHGPGYGGGFTGKNGQSFHVILDQQGSAFLCELRAGVAIKVQLTDRWQSVIDEKTAVLKGEGIVSIQLKLDRDARSLIARVVDSLEGSIPGARVRVGSMGVATTDTDGRFQIKGIRGQTISLHVEKKGFALFHDPAFSVPDDGSEVRIELETGEEATLEVVDNRGRPVSPSEAEATVGHVTVRPAVRDGNRFVFHNVARRPRSFRARIAGEVYEVNAPPGQASVRLVVPPHGVLNVSLTSPIGGWLRLKLTTKAGDIRNFTVALKGNQGIVRGRVFVPCGRVTLAGSFQRMGGSREVVRNLEPREIAVGLDSALDVLLTFQ